MPQAHRPESSWDILNGMKKFEHSYEEFDSRNASERHLAFAQGDLPNNKVGGFASGIALKHSRLDEN
jgi:hypothetical protein